MTNPPAGPLRYLIGAEENVVAAALARHELVEPPYDYSGHSKIRYGTLTDEQGRYRNWISANRIGKYRPYLPPNDITDQYGEYCPNPIGHGFLTNVTEQVRRAVAAGAERIELDNADYDGLGLGAVLMAHDLASNAGLKTIAKNPLNVSDPKRYLAHPSIDLVVMEHDDQGRGSDAMDELRRAIGQPHLAVRFVGFHDHGANNAAWCRAVAAQIRVKHYVNMGVTFSSDGEYTSSEDLIVPYAIREAPDGATD